MVVYADPVVLIMICMYMGKSAQRHWLWKSMLQLQTEFDGAWLFLANVCMHN